MKRCLITMCFVVLAVSAALAQGKKTVPPPPKPADDGPSLVDTMKFIQEKLNDIGPVNFVEHDRENVGTDWTRQCRDQVTKVVADPSTCRISYHWKEAGKWAVGTPLESDWTEQDGDIGFYLKAVKDIIVMSEKQVLEEGATEIGSPYRPYQVDPPVFNLRVRMRDKGYWGFEFLDEQLAHRVAKAMVHAVELCGGGSKPEPF